MKKAIFTLAALATMALCSSCHKDQCICYNWEHSVILNSWTCDPEKYYHDNCEDINGIVWFEGKNGLECHDNF